MPRTFKLPHFYESPILSVVKRARSERDPRKRDLAPTVLDFGRVRFKIARHFGFCYGVENAIEVAYQAIAENPDRRIFLLSEIIHNPRVNEDLRERGVRFLTDTTGAPLLPFDILRGEDVVIVPAFGTTLEIEEQLHARGVTLTSYNTTCPFVEKVWRRSQDIGREGYTIVIHGKRRHEETRATFSHAQATGGAVIVIRDLSEAAELAGVIRRAPSSEDGGGGRPPGADADFLEKFAGRCTPNFSPGRDLRRIGIVNQTTMLATETQAIADLLREAMKKRYGMQDLSVHFADTRDTLCYATKENQDATLSLIADGGDIAIVVGGYNSSNTSHLVELCEGELPTYFIRDAAELLSRDEVRHFDLETRGEVTTRDYLVTSWDADDGLSRTDILLTAGASCPDVLLDEVIHKILSWFPKEVRSVAEVLEAYQA